MSKCVCMFLAHATFKDTFHIKYQLIGLSRLSTKAMSLIRKSQIFWPVVEARVRFRQVVVVVRVRASLQEVNVSLSK